MLSDTMIKQALDDGRLRFIPEIDSTQIQPASIDLTLGTTFKVMRSNQTINPHDVSNILYDTFESPYGGFILLPGMFALATTRESIRLAHEAVNEPYTVPRYPDRIGSKDRTTLYHHYPPLVGRVEGRSSLGRLGLMVHITAGFIDPGFEGNITLELYNCSPNTIILEPGMRVCQISLFETGYVQAPYGHKGKYNGQKETTVSKGI